MKMTLEDYLADFDEREVDDRFPLLDVF